MKVCIKLILCLVYTFFTGSAVAQQSQVNLDGVTPMHEFLQDNADSTIILHFNSNWTHIPEWFILSKKGDTLTAYHYHAFPAYDQRVVLPQAVALKLRKRLVNQHNVTVDINEYFNPVYFQQDTLSRFWQRANQLKPWQIKDDAQEGIGCPVVKGKEHTEIFDAGGVTVHLMTKDNVKKLYFYAPEFYQKQCPRMGRREMLALQGLFLSYFKPDAL